ncbi:unnamed protein product, partial [Rotaria sp. Silwood2]
MIIIVNLLFSILNIFFLLIYLFIFIVVSDYISYQPSSTFIYPQEPMVSTAKILINPFFRTHSTNQTSESLSEIDNKCPTLIEQQ